MGISGPIENSSLEDITLQMNTKLHRICKHDTSCSALYEETGWGNYH